MAINKLPSDADLKEVASKTNEIKTEISNCRNRLAEILKSKDITVGTDKLQSLIEKADTLSKPQAKVYGVKVSESTSSTSLACTYIDDAVGITPATSTSYGGWADKFPFNKIRLVGFKNGSVTKEVDPNNKVRYKDGTAIPSDVDVMVQIPRIYWNFSDVTNTGFEVRISDKKFYGSNCFAHLTGYTEKTYIYVGAYLGYNEGGRLRSRSGVDPTGRISINDARRYAQANGSGYQQMTWYTVMLLQILYLIAYKNLDCQTSLGMGYTERGSTTLTGGTDNKGMVYGESTGTQQMCFLGIEDLWGNLYQHVDGLYIDTKYNIFVPNLNRRFEDSTNGLINIGNCGISQDISNGYLTKTIHSNRAGFIGIENTGTYSTYYCDSFVLQRDNRPTWGSSYNHDKRGGVFNLSIDNPSTSSYSINGCRLTYIGS